MQALVIELVEGEDLSQRIARGATLGLGAPVVLFPTRAQAD